MDLNVVESEINPNRVDNVDKHEDRQLNTQNEFQLPEPPMDHVNSENESDPSLETAFKKPVLLIGSRYGKTGAGRLITNVNSTPFALPDAIPASTNQIISVTKVPECDQIDTAEKKHLLLFYKEPLWAGIPSHKYKVEILKSGVIIDSINLNEKSFYIIGRLPQCDIPLAHPTISRYHAILQYRSVGDNKHSSGYYIYDLQSTHGTFWNGCRIKPKHYVKLQGGHIIRFGCSQRKFIFKTPLDEVEKESEYTVTELKEMRRLELMKREQEEKEQQAHLNDLERIKEDKEKTEGIDWGMSEDANEETDTNENPFAFTTNEELFLDDPKKTLRGWFEREGLEMQYQTEEKGIGQFLCWIELPIDTTNGHHIRAEALVKGKKKESVIQCALEACRILDRQGLLRQATHEAKKRKLRNWEEEDYYDSDEDNYLDRTGTVERKREQRMRNAGKLETKAETYTSLVEKHSMILTEISKIQTKLKHHEKAEYATAGDPNEDVLDIFMSNLSSALLNKTDIKKMNRQLQNMRKEEEELKKLIDITKPANLPSLNSLKSLESRVEPTENSRINQSVRSHDKYQRLENRDSEQHLVTICQYGLIKEDEVVSLKGEEMKKVCDVEKVKNIQTTQNIDDDIKDVENSADDNTLINGNEALNKKKQNIRKIQQRAESVEKCYDENLYREDYSMWIPPENQCGDGKTCLNDKLGY